MLIVNNIQLRVIKMQFKYIHTCVLVSQHVHVFDVN